MIAAGRIQHENNLTRMLALFARHDRERAQAQTREQTEATTQTDAPVVESSSITDPNRSAYGWGNISSSLSEGAQTGWYTGKTVGSGVFYGLIGFVQQIADSASFGYENFGVSGFFSGLGHGVGAGMAEGAKSIYQHGWAQMKVAAQAYVSPELSPELAGTQIGNGLMVPIGAIGLIDGARMTFKAPAMMESGLRHGADILKNSLEAAKNFIDDFDNNSPSGGAFATAHGNIMSGGAADAAIMSLPWDELSFGGTLALSKGSGADLTALNEVMEKISQSRDKANRIIDAKRNWRHLSPEQKRAAVQEALELVDERKELYQRIYQITRELDITPDQLTQLEVYLDTVQETLGGLSTLPADVKIAFLPVVFLREQILVNNSRAHYFLRAKRYAEADTQFVINAEDIQRYINRIEHTYPPEKVCALFPEMLNIVHHSIAQLLKAGQLEKVIPLSSHLFKLMEREFYFILEKAGKLPEALVTRWTHVLDLFTAHPFFLNSFVIVRLLDLSRRMRPEPELLRDFWPVAENAIHAADYLRHVADIFENFAKDHPSFRPVARIFREVSNAASSESLQ